MHFESLPGTCSSLELVDIEDVIDWTVRPPKNLRVFDEWEFVKFLVNRRKDLYEETDYRLNEFGWVIACTADDQTRKVEKNLSLVGFRRRRNKVVSKTGSDVTFWIASAQTLDRRINSLAKKHSIPIPKYEED